MSNIVTVHQMEATVMIFITLPLKWDKTSVMNVQQVDFFCLIVILFFSTQLEGTLQ